MCGIIGHINLEAKIDKTQFVAMRDTLQHRGPDDAGVHFTDTQQIALGHTRLSFFDLGPNGHQPMHLSAQGVTLTFNGEIYNFIELKESLKAHYNFITNTDTEVIIAAYLQWGIECVKRFKGMFAFGLLDENSGKLFLVRDHFGIKPLYYYKDSNNLIFASELKAIVKSEQVEQEVNWSAFCDYFVYRYIPTPKTIWNNIFKVPAAHILTFDTNSLAVTESEYWQLNSTLNPSKEDEFLSYIDNQLDNSIRKHSRADVEVGSFLSGGYDSSALVHYSVKDHPNLKTFSIGFKKWANSEDKFAKIVADHYGVENTAVIADKEDLSLLERMPNIYDEPIADISIVPTYMVSKLAREKVKAVLSGEGADEAFVGYHWQKDYYKKMHPRSFVNRVKQLLKPTEPIEFYAFAMAMGNFDRAELKKMLHDRLHSFIPEDVHWFYREHYKPEFSPLKAIQHLDIKCFMGELVLTKVDRASMANSLEVRVPFLDWEMFERVFAEKEAVYHKPEITKHPLHEAIKEAFPSEILKREKQGFVGPDSYYMDTNWYRQQLSNSVLVEQKIVKRNYIDHLLDQDYDWRLWKIVVMEKWFKKWAA